MKGGWDFEDAHKNGNLVAICETDKHRLASAAKRYPKAKPYADYRKMLDEMDKSIDGVASARPTTATPSSVTAMKMGKHCFCQKPLTHTIGEARLMAQIAREKKLCTQMGNQGTAPARCARPRRRSVGGLGKVTEVHVWTARPNWPQGDEKPARRTLPRAARLGPVDRTGPHASLRQVLPPHVLARLLGFRHRRLGDMACHTVNMPYMGLDLRNPTTVVARPPATIRTASRSGRKSPSSSPPTTARRPEAVLVRRRQAPARSTLRGKADRRPRLPGGRREG